MARKTATRRIILASASPRRKELMKEMGLKFSIIPSRWKEKKSGMGPRGLALHNAKAKADDVARRSSNAIVIGVDTIGVARGKILGKPKHERDAIKILKTISGTKHKVISGICVIDTAKNLMITDYEETIVEMDFLTPAQVKSYLATGEGRDKAAGYAIQGRGAIHIKRINGDYFNVVGLPIYKLAKILAKLGVKW